MEIKWKITTLYQLIDAIEKVIDLKTLIAEFDRYEFLMKNRGEQENNFINKHRNNKEKIKLIHNELDHLNRVIKKSISEFEALDNQIAKTMK